MRLLGRVCLTCRGPPDGGSPGGRGVLNHTCHGSFNPKNVIVSKTGLQTSPGPPAGLAAYSNNIDMIAMTSYSIVDLP